MIQGHHHFLARTLKMIVAIANHTLSVRLINPALREGESETNDMTLPQAEVVVAVQAQASVQAQAEVQVPIEAGVKAEVDHQVKCEVADEVRTEAVVKIEKDLRIEKTNRVKLTVEPFENEKTNHNHSHVLIHVLNHDRAPILGRNHGHNQDIGAIVMERKTNGVVDPRNTATDTLSGILCFDVPNNSIHFRKSPTLFLSKISNHNHNYNRLYLHLTSSPSYKCNQADFFRPSSSSWSERSC